MTNPKLVLIVGAIGFAFNILGLFVFHQHDHGHDHGHGHGEGEEHEHEHEHAHEHVDGEHDHAGHSHGHADSSKPHDHAAENEASATNRISWSSPERRRHSQSIHRRTGSRNYSSIEDLPIYPASLRNDIQARARGDESEGESEDYAEGEEESAVVEENGQPSEVTSLLKKGNQRGGSSRRKAHRRSQQGGTLITHQGHNHNQPRPQAQSGGHSHADMNTRGIFLHVLGDALGNVGVMASALIIWLTSWKFRFYFDPAISLVITMIILKSAIPLIRDTSKPLLQAVPSHISVKDIEEDIKSLPGIVECHDIHVWALTPTTLIATLHVKLNFNFEGEGAAQWMELAKAIKDCLHGFGIHRLTIQPEFCTNEEHHHNSSASEVLESEASSSGADTVVGSGALSTAPNGGSVPCGDACMIDCGEACKPGGGAASGTASGTATPKKAWDVENQKSDHHQHKHR